MYIYIYTLNIPKCMDGSAGTAWTVAAAACASMDGSAAAARTVAAAACSSMDGSAGTAWTTSSSSVARSAACGLINPRAWRISSATLVSCVPNACVCVGPGSIRSVVLLDLALRFRCTGRRRWGGQRLRRPRPLATGRDGTVEGRHAFHSGRFDTKHKRPSTRAATPVAAQLSCISTGS